MLAAVLYVQTPEVPLNLQNGTALEAPQVANKIT